MRRRKYSRSQLALSLCNAAKCSEIPSARLMAVPLSRISVVPVIASPRGGCLTRVECSNAPGMRIYDQAAAGGKGETLIHLNG